MKKIFLLACVIIASANVYSQNVSYEIKAGLNFTKLPMTFAGNPYANNTLVGFNGGVLVDVNWGSFSFQPGLLFTTKGGKSPGTAEVSTGIQQNASGTVSYIVNYLEAPLTFIYRIKTGSGNIFFGAGPYIAYGLNAKNEFNGNYGGSSDIQVNTETLGDDPSAKIARMDLGVNTVIGYQWARFVISGGYEQSIFDISNTANSAKNQGFNISVGLILK